MGFGFRLEKVLRWKKEMEKRKLMAMASVQRQREMAIEGIRRLEDESKELARGFNDLKGRKALPEELRWHWARKRWLSEEINKQKQLLLSLDEKLEMARNDWSEARKQREVVEKFRERVFLRYLEEQSRMERKILDEVALICRQAKEREG